MCLLHLTDFMPLRLKASSYCQCHTGYYVFFLNSETFIMFMILGQERSWRSSVSVQVPLLGHNRAVHRTLWMRSIIATFGPSFHPLWSLGRLWMHNLIMQGMKYCSSPLRSFVHWRTEHYRSLFYAGKNNNYLVHTKMTLTLFITKAVVFSLFCTPQKEMFRSVSTLLFSIQRKCQNEWWLGAVKLQKTHTIKLT